MIALDSCTHSGRSAIYRNTNAPPCFSGSTTNCLTIVGTLLMVALAGALFLMFGARCGADLRVRHEPDEGRRPESDEP